LKELPLFITLGGKLTYTLLVAID